MEAAGAVWRGGEGGELIEQSGRAGDGIVELIKSPQTLSFLFHSVLSSSSGFRTNPAVTQFGMFVIELSNIFYSFEEIMQEKGKINRRDK